MVTVGPFQLLDLLGRGGMGEVWAARHRESLTRVAVKIVSRDADRPAFEREVRAAAGLRHPAIVVVLDHGATTTPIGRAAEGAPWMAMELASGGTLRSAAPADWQGVRQVTLTALDALAHAHARGVVHCDVKPANLLLATARDLRPDWKLADFGISRSTGQHLDGQLRERRCM